MSRPQADPVGRFVDANRPEFLHHRVGEWYDLTFLRDEVITIGDLARVIDERDRLKAAIENYLTVVGQHALDPVSASPAEQLRGVLINEALKLNAAFADQNLHDEIEQAVGNDESAEHIIALIRSKAAEL